MSATKKPICLEVAFEWNAGSPMGQCRATPVRLGEGASPAVLLTYGADFDVDPYIEMFFFPTDTLKMVLLDARGSVLWRRDLGRAVVPGIWFCPVFVFDLDGDGVDEIWFVNNRNEQHPLGMSGYCLERLDGKTGETIGQWTWRTPPISQSLSHLYRNFILGGYVHQSPTLVTAQGTYGDMFLQGWNADMSPRWELYIPENAPGARGSHMCSVVDLDGDGVDEVLWGERAIALDAGTERFCADRDTYRGHSDIAQPVFDRKSGRWSFYVCRESDGAASPRVLFYDAAGRRVWGDVERGHMDMGWIAHLSDETVAMAIRIGRKTCGPDGRFHQDRDEFTYRAFTGVPYSMPFPVYQTLPVDVNGDGYHEFVRGVPGGDGAVFDANGTLCGSVGGTVAIAAKILDAPGEQILAFEPDGRVRIWRDANAVDSDVALARYANPFYETNARLMSVGYHLPALGGI